MLFSVADLVSLSLSSRLTTSQAESVFFFFSHFRSSSFRWKNSIIIISISFCDIVNQHHMKNAVFLKTITMITSACSFSFYNSSKNKKLIKRLTF